MSNDEALSILQLNIERGYRASTMNKKNFVEAWDAIAEQYGSKSASRGFSLREQFFEVS